MGQLLIIKLIFLSLCLGHQEALPTEGVSPVTSATSGGLTSTTAWISSVGPLNTTTEPNATASEDNFAESDSDDGGLKGSEDGDSDEGDREIEIHSNDTINDGGGGRDDGGGGETGDDSHEDDDNDEYDESDEDENSVEFDDSDDDGDDDDDDNETEEDDSDNDDDEDDDDETEEDEESDDYEYLYTDSYDHLNHTYDGNYDDYDGFYDYDYYDSYNYSDYTYDYDNSTPVVVSNISLSTVAEENEVMLGDDGKIYMFLSVNSSKHIDIRDLMMDNSTHFLRDINEENDAVKNNEGNAVTESVNNDNDTEVKKNSTNDTDDKPIQSMTSENETSEDLENDDEDDGSVSLVLMSTERENEIELKITENDTSVKNIENDFVPQLPNDTNVYVGWTSVTILKSDINDWQVNSVDESAKHDDGESDNGESESESARDSEATDIHKNNHSVEVNEDDNDPIINTAEEENTKLNETGYQQANTSGISNENEEPDKGLIISERESEKETDSADVNENEIIALVTSTVNTVTKEKGRVNEEQVNLKDGDGKNKTDNDKNTNDIIFLILNGIANNYTEYKPNDTILLRPNVISTEDREENATKNIFIGIDTASGTADPYSYTLIFSNFPLPNKTQIVDDDDDKSNGTLYYEVDNYDDDDDNITASSKKIVDYMTEDELKEFLEKYKDNIETKDELFDNTTTWNETKTVNNVTNEVNNNHTLETDTDTDVDMNATVITTNSETENVTIDGNNEINNENDSVSGKVTKSYFAGGNVIESEGKFTTTENTDTESWTDDISDRETMNEDSDDIGSTGEEYGDSEVTDETWLLDHDSHDYYDLSETDENQTSEVDYTTISIYANDLQESETSIEDGTEGNLPDREVSRNETADVKTEMTKKNNSNENTTDIKLLEMKAKELTLEDLRKSDIYSRIYDDLIKSNDLTQEEKHHLGDLERLRRYVDTLGGLRVIRRDPKAHHIVRRQIQTMEACGAFSKRRRRDISTGNYGSIAVALAANKPLEESFASQLRRKLQWLKDEEQLHPNPSEFSMSSATRHKRGINNVGKRLENGNPGFKQLYNQYKNMCSFIAMVAFEK